MNFLANMPQSAHRRWSRVCHSAVDWVASRPVPLLAGGAAAAGLVIVVAGLTVYGWRARRGPTGPSALSDPEIAAAAERAATDQSADRLTWQKVTATKTARVPDSLLMFTLDGRPTQQTVAGEAYYLVDRSAYQHFAPRDRDDLVRLQLPDTALRPLGETASFVEPAATWLVPADLPGQIHYRVDFETALEATVGTPINGPFTIWITPWADYQRELTAVASVPLASPAASLD